MYEEGRRLYEARLFGQSLAAFQSAVAERESQYGMAAAAIEAVTGEKDLEGTKDSLKALVRKLAERDLIDAVIAGIEARAASSLRAEVELLLKENLSADFGRFLKGLLLVLDRRPASSLKDSIRGLKTACEELASYPEAETWIGKVYQAEAEYRLAELQFKRAWDMREALDVPDERFDILQGLAAIYQATKSWRSYEEVLGRIIQEDPLFADRKAFLREAMERSLGQQGFDRYYRLYRSQGGPWTGAELELGEFYLESGRPQALSYLTVSVTSIMSIASSRLLEKSPEWEFRSLTDLVGRIQADRTLRAYAEAANLYRGLYKLGLALDANGYRQSARGLWAVLAATAGIEPWNTSSSQALAAATKR
jgi:hypothetical protein